MDMFILMFASCRLMRVGLMDLWAYLCSVLYIGSLNRYLLWSPSCHSYFSAYELLDTCVSISGSWHHQVRTYRYQARHLTCVPKLVEH